MQLRLHLCHVNSIGALCEIRFRVEVAERVRQTIQLGGDGGHRLYNDGCTRRRSQSILGDAECRAIKIVASVRKGHRRIRQYIGHREQR